MELTTKLIGLAHQRLQGMMGMITVPECIASLVNEQQFWDQLVLPFAWALDLGNNFSLAYKS